MNQQAKWNSPVENTPRTHEALLRTARSWKLLCRTVPLAVHQLAPFVSFSSANPHTGVDVPYKPPSSNGRWMRNHKPHRYQPQPSHLVISRISIRPKMSHLSSPVMLETTVGPSKKRTSPTVSTSSTRTRTRSRSRTRQASHSPSLPMPTRTPLFSGRAAGTTPACSCHRHRWRIPTNGLFFCQHFP